MKPFDFNKVINRYGTDSVRWEKYNQDVIPLSVADMDFAAAPCIVEALKKRINHKVYGYTHAPQDLRESIVTYVNKFYDWQIDPEWIVFLPSLVSSLYSIASNVTHPKAHILTLQPVYHHILNAAKNSGRNYSEIPLSTINQRLVLNSQSIDNFAQPNSELLLFCNPHNPGGTVYTRNELSRIAQICDQKNLIICSDEIHCGMVFEGKKHIPIASISNDAADRTITLMSLNKTYNIPGIGLAWLVCKNQKLRQKACVGLGTLIPDPQIFTYTSTQAAINQGEPWRKALMSYLSDNRDLLRSTIADVPAIDLYQMEASYLGWLSCEQLQIDDPSQLFLDYGVALQPGSMFNKVDHVRINIATPKIILLEALKRMKQAVS